MIEICLLNFGGLARILMRSWVPNNKRRQIFRRNTVFVVSIPNVWGTIDKLVTQGLPPSASRAFYDLAREVD